MKQTNTHYPSFFGRLPICVDRDVLVLECKIKGPRQDVWVQLTRLPRNKVRCTARLTFPVCCDKSFLFADGKTLAGSKIILGYDLGGRLVSIFWREKLRRAWKYEFDLSQLSDRPLELRPGCRCVFTSAAWAARFHDEFIEFATGVFNPAAWSDILDHMLEVRSPLPVTEFPPSPDEDEGEGE